MVFALFDALGEWFGEEDFSGCTFINASAEYGRQDDPVHAVAAEHKRLMRAYVRALAAAAGARDADALAGQLMLLIEGAVVMAHVAGERDAARQARLAAEILVARAVPG